jgi:plasmid stabilization system protein ParE
MEQTIENLSEFPGHCAVASEGRRGRVIRQLLYGRKPHIYRVLFRVIAKDRVVTVIHIRHGARLPATDGD